MTHSTQRTGNEIRLVIVALLFLLSGAAGLIYQIVWQRLLEIYFGVTMTAIALIVAAYMAGLGLGSLLGGRLAQRIKRPVLAYGLVEVAIAAFGFFSSSLINWIGQRTAGSPYPVVFLLSFALLLIPTLLMGMTLPLLTQSFVSRVDTSGHVIGWLYGINTLGAALGALIGGYLLIGWLGFEGATQAAVIINLGVGAGAIVFLGNQAQTTTDESPGSQAVETSNLPYRTVLLAAFLTGFINLGFEMLWFRVLGIWNKTTAYGFPSVLFIFLAGLAIGGFIWGRKADQSEDRVALFWKLQLGSGIIIVSTFLIVWGALQLPALQPWIKESFNNPQQPFIAFAETENGLVFSRRLMISNLAWYFLPILVLVLPASLLMGGGLPLLDRIAITSASVSGRRVGDIHLANILGSVTGSLAISFLFLSALGTELTLKVLVLLSLVFISLVWRNRQKAGRALYVLPACLVGLVLVAPWQGRFYETLYQSATGIQALVHESGDSVLVLGYQSEAYAPSTLWIGGIQNSYYPTYGHYERSAFTCASASHPKRVLIIGLGGANTAYFITQIPGVEEIVIVELMEDLGTLLNQYAPAAQAALQDARVRYVTDDGRRYLYAHPGETYDMIFIDPLYSFTTGHNNLYSLEAMQLYRSHLTPGGVFCGWMNEHRIIPKTVAGAFPHVEQFLDWVVAGTDEIVFDRDFMTRGLAAFDENSRTYFPNAVFDTLQPEAIFEKYVGNRACILEKGRDIPFLTDARPRLEYYYFSPPTRRASRCK